MAEQHVLEVKQGVAAALAQAGLPHKYWCYAINYFETAWNISQHRGLDKTPWELRFGELFPAQSIPFGAAVTYLPHRASRLWEAKKTHRRPGHTRNLLWLAVAVGMQMVRRVLCGGEHRLR